MTLESIYEWDPKPDSAESALEDAFCLTVPRTLISASSQLLLLFGTPFLFHCRLNPNHKEKSLLKEDIHNY